MKIKNDLIGGFKINNNCIPIELIQCIEKIFNTEIQIVFNSENINCMKAEAKFGEEYENWQNNKYRTVEECSAYEPDIIDFVDDEIFSIYFENGIDINSNLTLTLSDDSFKLHFNENEYLFKHIFNKEFSEIFDDKFEIDVYDENFNDISIENDVSENSDYDGNFIFKFKGLEIEDIKRILKFISEYIQPAFPRNYKLKELLNLI